MIISFISRLPAQELRNSVGSFVTRCVLFSLINSSPVFKNTNNKQTPVPNECPERHHLLNCHSPCWCPAWGQCRSHPLSQWSSSEAHEVAVAEIRWDEFCHSGRLPWLASAPASPCGRPGSSRQQFLFWMYNHKSSTVRYQNNVPKEGLTYSYWLSASKDEWTAHLWKYKQHLIQKTSGSSPSEDVLCSSWSYRWGSVSKDSVTHFNLMNKTTTIYTQVKGSVVLTWVNLGVSLGSTVCSFRLMVVTPMSIKRKFKFCCMWFYFLQRFDVCQC